MYWYTCSGLLLETYFLVILNPQTFFMKFNYFFVVITMPYYKIKGSDIVHGSRSCSYLRKKTGSELEIYGSPPEGELCDRCVGGRD